MGLVGIVSSRGWCREHRRSGPANKGAGAGAAHVCDPAWARRRAGHAAGGAGGSEQDAWLCGRGKGMRTAASLRHHPR